MTTIRGFVYLEDEAAFDVQAETFRVGEERFRLETILRGLSGGNGEQGPAGPQGEQGPQGEPADLGALELVASTNAPDVQQEIGSYAPIRDFTILESDPHVVRTDTNGLLTLRVDRLRAGNTTTVGTFEAINGAGQLSLTNGPTEFLVGDVLLVVIETCPSDCSRVSTTLSVRLQESV